MILVKYRNVLQDTAGNAVIGALVTVTVYGTGAADSLYSDALGLYPILGNAVLTDSKGEFSFCVEEGRYNFSMTMAGAAINAETDVSIVAPTFAQIVSARAFGMSPNASASYNQGAFEDACLSVSSTLGSTVIVPPGLYPWLPLELSGRANLRIEGYGIENTKLLSAATGAALSLLNCQWATVGQLTLQTSGNAQSIAGSIGLVMANGTSNCEVDRIAVTGFNQNGVELIGTSGSPLTGNKVRNAYLLGNGQKQLYATYAHDGDLHNIQAGRLAGIALPTHGFYLDNCENCDATKLRAWDNGVGGAFLSCNDLTILGSRFEESQSEGLVVLGGADVIVSKTRLHSNSKFASGTSDAGVFTSVAGLTLTGNRVYTRHAQIHRWGLNVDDGCDKVTIEDNGISAFNANFGAIRVSGAVVTPVSSDSNHEFTTVGTVAAGATTFLGTNGEQATEAATYALASKRKTFLRLYCRTVLAPGSGETFTYTLRVSNGASAIADTAMVVTISGSAFVGAASTPAPAILVGPDDVLTVKLVASAGAAVTRHSVQLTAAEY